MPRASGRLDVHLCAAPPDRAVDAGPLQALAIASGWWAQDGSPGPAAAALLPGGFRAVSVVRHARAALVANHQGGFRVRCPSCGASVVAAFQAAYAAWRDQGRVEPVRCDACGAVAALEALDFQPAAAFTRLEVVLQDAGSIQPDPAALAELTACAGPFRVVGRRVG